MHPLSPADISIFSLEIIKFCCINKYRYITGIDGILIHNLLTYFETFLMDFLINIVTILMSAKMALLKIKVFLIKDYGVIIFVYELIYENVSRDSNHTVVVVM